MTKFKHAIVRRPCPEIINGLSNNNLSKPDYKKALIQHDKYISALQSCNLDLIILSEDNRFPDSVFVEDTAVCTSKFALISKPGAPEREKEIDIITPALKEYFEKIEFITGKEPTTVPQENIAYSYPGYRAFNYYRTEANINYFNLDMGQPKLFSVTDEWVQKARISPVSGGQAQYFDYTTPNHSDNYFKNLIP